MSEVSEAIQAKCLAFGDRVIKLNDYLLSQAAMEHENYKKSKIQKKGKQTSSLCHLTSSISQHIIHQPSYIRHLYVSRFFYLSTGCDSHVQLKITKNF